MELAYRIQEAFKDGRNPLRKELAQLSIDVFGESIKERCDSCIPDLIRRLKKYAAQQMGTPAGKYRFTKAWEKKKVVVNIGGTSYVVTAESLSVATAEMILNNPQYRKDIIELNPAYTGVQEVKKNLNQKEPLPISSILDEVLTDGTGLAESVNGKESSTEELKPLTGEKKKRGRPSK